MRRQGFTLVEMLVVMAVLVLLSSLGLPLVGATLERGRTARCQANLRAMSQAVHIFLNENEGRFPPALVSENGRQMGWDFFGTGAGREPEPGWIWRDYGVNQILQCPSFKGADNWSGHEHTGYNYNASYLGGMRITVRDRLLRDVPSANIVQVAHPGRTALFGDGEYAAGANKFMRAPQPGLLDGDFSGREAGTQGFRHRGKTMMVYVDGHVQSLSLPPQPGALAARLAPGTGFLGADNAAYDLD